MTWTEITRRPYRREGLRYGSDTTDAEWFVMEPLLPPASALGRPRATDMRTVIDAILYIASTGCQWRQLPKDFPPYSTVQVISTPGRGVDLCRAQLHPRDGIARGGRPRGEPDGRSD